MLSDKCVNEWCIYFDSAVWIALNHLQPSRPRTGLHELEDNLKEANSHFYPYFCLNLQTFLQDLINQAAMYKFTVR